MQYQHVPPHPDDKRRGCGTPGMVISQIERHVGAPPLSTVWRPSLWQWWEMAGARWELQLQGDNIDMHYISVGKHQAVC